MTHYSHIPLVRILLPVMMGIIVFDTLGIILSLQIILLVLLVFLFLGFLVNRYLLPKFQYSFVYGLNVSLFLLFAGYVLAQSRFDLARPNHFSNYQLDDSMLRIMLLEPVEEKTNSFQLIGKVIHVSGGDTLIKTAGKLIIWLEKDERARDLSYGDIILIENYSQAIKEPQNPHSFNYKRFLSRQNIFHQTYRKSSEWFFTGKNEGNFIFATAHQMRQRALDILTANNIHDKDFAVASALILGYSEYLDEDLQREFSGAGAMHILCVSGLHVGIIFLVLKLLFGYFLKMQTIKYISTFIIIIIIWLYAAITGFSPSVLRAATMFSFVALGQSFSRSTNIYNTLAGSALLLVSVDPMIITRLGFQLSYLAVICIVWLQPWFYRQLYFKNKIADYVWGIITVSIAAQLGTSPLTLYYFNQFPNYFLLTNIVVIPLTGIILKGGILLFILSPFTLISQFFGMALSWALWILHSYVRFVEGLPSSTTNNIVIFFHEQLLIMFLIVLTGMFLLSKRVKLIHPILITMLILSISFTARFILNQNRKQLIVYNVPKSTAIDIVNGKSIYLWASEGFLENPALTRFNLQGNRLALGVGAENPLILNQSDKTIDQPVFKYGSTIRLNEHTIKIIDKEIFLPGTPFPGTIQHIIISNNPSISMGDLSREFSPSMIVFDSSNSVRRIEKWKQECDSLGLQCWSVTLQGAYVADL
jgi:competence protein ComEC